MSKSTVRLWTKSADLSRRKWTILAFVAFVCFCVYTIVSRHDGTNGRSGAILARTYHRLGKIVMNQGQRSSKDNPHTEGDLGEETVVLYNRVPKTGSTTLLGIIDQLSLTNSYQAINFNISRLQRVLGLADQRRFVTNISNWEEVKPVVYHGHLAFLDFQSYGVKQLPIYINMVRDPLERLMSHYYFLRYGDDFDPHRARKMASDQTTFDECVEQDGAECGPIKMWVQIPFFCGHHAGCWEPGNEWALEEAKRNLREKYLVVGITEEFSYFLAVLEAALPRFFRGATDLYERGSQSHLRKTNKKILPSLTTLLKMEKSRVYRMEREFYSHAVDQFHFIRDTTIGMTETRKLYIRQKSIHFNKIR
ncbi:hypothetical protein RRG08_013492 [Elysia crispata]|uniref:Heparan sulfate 2-O-sulfotransferase 1 n=1 Tax=Elysia crispata TaxID=231223 RepID=A0AAE1CR22_9GAST|nr:hypothetical protein RRG08_013492 [Elysia crispata]